MGLNGKVLKVDNPTKMKVNPNEKEESKMGYRDDSPYRNMSYINIDTPNGIIDMSNVSIPLYANGQLLLPYSGKHQFNTNKVKEVPVLKNGGWLDKYQNGSQVDKSYSSSPLAKGKLQDNRKIRKTTGLKINPNNDLVNYPYDKIFIEEQIQQAIDHNEDPKKWLSIINTESKMGYGNRMSNDPGHYNYSYKDQSEEEYLIDRLKGKLQENNITDDNIIDDAINKMVNQFSLDKSFKAIKNAKRLNKSGSKVEEYMRYNSPYYDTNDRNAMFKASYKELDGDVKNWFGIPLPVDKRLNPVYGNQLTDVEDNVIGKDPYILSRIQARQNAIINNIPKNRINDITNSFRGKLQDGGQHHYIDPEKAYSFLENGFIYGHPLTMNQDDYFSTIANIERDEDGEIIPMPEEDESAEGVEEYDNMRLGGKVKGLPRGYTSKNIQTSINEVYKRNYDIYGTFGKYFYHPKAQDGGTVKWLDKYNND